MCILFKIGGIESFKISKYIVMKDYLLRNIGKYEYIRINLWKGIQNMEVI